MSAKYNIPTPVEIDVIIDMIASEENIDFSDRQWLIITRALEAFKENDIG